MNYFDVFLTQLGIGFLQLAVLFAALYLLGLEPIRQLIFRIPFIGDLGVQAAEIAVRRQIERQLKESAFLESEARRLVEGAQQVIENGGVTKEEAAQHTARMLEERTGFSASEAELAIENAVRKLKKWDNY